MTEKVDGCGGDKGVGNLFKMNKLKKKYLSQHLQTTAVSV